MNQAIESFRDGDRRHSSVSSGHRPHKPTTAGESCCSDTAPTETRGRIQRPRYHQQQPPHGQLPLEHQQQQPAYPAAGGAPPHQVAHPTHHMMMPPHWWTPEMLQAAWHYSYEHPYYPGQAPPPGYWGPHMIPPGASANHPPFWTAAATAHQQPLATHQPHPAPPPPPPHPPALAPSVPSTSKDPGMEA